jgi:predicted DsbA family dithiol-disulfide isomerase
VSTESAERIEAFETWLLRPVAQAVEAGEVPEAFLTELQAEIEAAKERAQDVGHAAAIRKIADLAGMDAEKAAEVWATMEIQPEVTRELLMRRIAEAWLAGQRRAHDRKGR